MIGKRLFPLLVSAYSTWGGLVAKVVREIKW